MEKFEAKNGLQIETDLGPVVRIWEGYARDKENNRLRGFSYLNDRDVEALREFFQYERDQELGWWRWPENPDYVVRLSDDGQAIVLNERTGVTAYRYRGEAAEMRAMRQRTGSGDVMPATRASEEYFDAHHEPKPWHEAVEGEVWLLMFPNSTQAWFVNGGYFQNVRTLTNINKTDPCITAGRRIWPEVSDA